MSEGALHGVVLFIFPSLTRSTGSVHSASHLHEGVATELNPPESAEAPECARRLKSGLAQVTLRPGAYVCVCVTRLGLPCTLCAERFRPSSGAREVAGLNCARTLLRDNGVVKNDRAAYREPYRISRAAK